jgi:ribose transport system substrate-binding protein
VASLGAVAVATAVAAPALGFGVKPTGPGNVTVGKKCGQTVDVGPANPNGAFKSMPKTLQDIYGSYPGKLLASPWAHIKIKAKPPWKIGYVAFAITNEYNQHVLQSMQAQFAIAKKQGLVKGSLITAIPASMAQSTPEAQITAIQQMVREGVNAIIVLPTDSVSESPAMEAAGKAGVPVVLADVPPAPGSKYQVAAWTQNQVEADAGTLGIIKKGNIVIVRGVAGNENDVVLYNQMQADLKNCPNIHQVATLNGNWDNATAKSVMTQYLASNPQPLAGVLQDGGMFAGVVEAYEARGAKVPPVGVEQCEGGDLSWWLAHFPSYKTVGGCINGYQGGSTYMRIALRILANKGPKWNVISMPAVTVDNTNLKKFAQPGLPLTSAAELPGGKNLWCNDTCLNQYFVTPGPAK